MEFVALIAIAGPVRRKRSRIAICTSTSARRIDTFFDPESDPSGGGLSHHPVEDRVGIGRAWGKGFGLGTQGHLDFLPEKQTDFIFTSLAEEFGFVGSVALLALYCLIVMGGMLIALRCPQPLRAAGGRSALRPTSSACGQRAMVMGVRPVVGVPLPLLSHGGSAMITVMVGFGLLMSAHVHRDVAFGEVGNVE